ncbi:PadR family transcriptional regulator [Actinoplanes sp. SE50]|uniref:PadR family transcriptional regulator n=1 Tax=unclassified Actinoplanes TaxID=2626549 RepID=UPI00023EC842|nr:MULTISPECIES: PadR family transcriptional regulator [unclassified Actinoplanes]AEV86474.1 Negative transcription regulator padR [Actinoplanes sp. SE50/110]ATO84872.1 PadR family transcriptional regulator [Actinoplanes sp. SE50]SLM02281.1 PadR family transcriptional regulator [Actinoplanes sp. SE50/110]
MSLRFALLGLLADRPSSGYDLLTEFRTSLAHVWPATQSQVYRELNTLTEAGMLTVGEEGPRGRREYRITAAGRDALDAWLTTPDSAPSYRSALLLRVFFLSLAGPERAAGFFRDQADLAGQRLSGYHDLVESRTWDAGTLERYGRIALEYGIRLAAMQRDWAIWAAGQLPDDGSPGN